MFKLIHLNRLSSWGTLLSLLSTCVWLSACANKEADEKVEITGQERTRVAQLDKEFGFPETPALTASVNERPHEGTWELVGFESLSKVDAGDDRLYFSQYLDRQNDEGYSSQCVAIGRFQSLLSKSISGYSLSAHLPTQISHAESGERIFSDFRYLLYGAVANGIGGCSVTSSWYKTDKQEKALALLSRLEARAVVEVDTSATGAEINTKVRVALVKVSDVELRLIYETKSADLTATTSFVFEKLSTPVTIAPAPETPKVIPAATPSQPAPSIEPTLPDAVPAEENQDPETE